MDKKQEMIIFAGIIILLLILAFFSYSGLNQNNNIFSSKEQNLNNYIEDMRDTQTKSQRDSTIKLYISTIDTGNVNKGKVLNPSEAPDVCELAKSIATGSTKEQKAEQLANYLSKEIEYDWGNVIIDTTGKPRTRTKKDPIEVIESKSAICGELANTYMLMGECVGVEVYFIYGGGHAWNVLYINGVYHEVDTTQGCYDCDISKPEHSYPILGLCDLNKCITISQIANLAATKPNLFDQTMGK
jgi:hypothetical protein